VAIAMWDFSWLLRHHPAGEFHDWSRVLDELVERGYNAVRMDMFPHLVAAGSDGTITEEYYFPKPDWKPAMWGNKYSVTMRPRQALLEFLPECTKRGVHVGFSTWFFGPGVEKVEGLDGFVRVWDETLSFLNSHGLLNNVFYVDLLNEYPMFHGFKWLENELKTVRKNWGPLKIQNNGNVRPTSGAKIWDSIAPPRRPSMECLPVMPSTGSSPNGQICISSPARHGSILCRGRTWISPALQCSMCTTGLESTAT
jgi:hypothetical protein